MSRDKTVSEDIPGRFFILLMGTGRGKRQEETYRKDADAQIAAWQPTPIETKKNERVTKFLGDWDSGKDVSEMDYVKPYFNLYNSAVNRQQNEEQGVGALGTNQLTGGDGRMGGLIGKQIAARNQQDASGQLYNAANQAYEGATNEGEFLINTSEGRAGNKAGLMQQRYTSYLNRPKKPSIWETLLQGGLQAGAAYAGTL